ncbi:MAG: BamA/TamA family outer membrane protein [Pseudomonadota bacterium]
MNRWLGLSFACCSSLSLTAAGAEPVPSVPSVPFPEHDSYSALESSVIRQNLAQRGFSLEDAPEGKMIEDVQIIPLDVFDERDPMPDFVNVFHATTREHVLRRELLFREGEPYRALYAQETARNLRSLQQLSIVLVVPVKGTRSDRVRVLVITKDVWSLRLNWALQLSNSNITSLVLNPSEENLFGLHAVVGALFTLDPATYSLGVSLAHRRLFGSHQQVALTGSLIKNRFSGDSEGSFGEFRYGQPLYSLDTRWSWGTSILWRHDIARRFVGVTVDTTAGIPAEYNRDRLYGGYELVRSFGRRFKYDLSVGFEADRRVYTTDDLSGYSPLAVQRFIAIELPVSDQRISPFVQLHAHRTDFRSLLDVETLGLQEDYRRGHDLLLRMYAASSKVGSTRDLVGSQATLAYTLPLADGFVRPVIGSNIEHASLGRDDALFETALRFVSPRLGFGRLIIDGEFLDRYRNYLNRRFVLGGDNRLRGYAPGAFPGAKVVSLNTELRSTSLDILSAQVGAAAFYDVGDAKNHVENFQLKQSVGLGLRVLFPEFDRIVLRADWGFPLSPGYQSFPGAFFLSFGQAFAMPTVPVPSVLTETL